MISIDEHPPPDPSSSAYQNQQQEVSHEALATVSDIDLLKPKDANLDDTNNPHPNFTIRDYVYRSRCKNITRNWPFSRESLQLCLNYSVDNLLPPFESLDSLRSISPEEETVTNFNRKSTDDRFISPTSSCIKSQCHREENLDHAKSNSQPTVKKSKFIMKSNSGVEPVEETVAFKVCPVCRTFSSSSNTTLNAHIDQCLSEESSMKSTANPKIKTVKHRIKSTKTRLMVDIYKTARHCTVEELDRRNGTSWATNSNFPDQELVFQEEKKEQPQEPTFVPKVADNEGAVYIDTNGTKVRILSIPRSNKFDDDNARKLQKGDKGSKFDRGKKKMKAYEQKNHRKILKLSPKSKKFSKKATSVRKENVAIEESHKKDGGENPMKAQANKQMDSLTIRRPPWACSKRTAVAKKMVPVLTKPKECARLCDGSEDTRSKGCKFSSLKKNLLVSASQEHKAGPKFSLKRKLSALKKPQDSWKRNSRMEEDTGEKLSFEIVNVAEVKKKNSITSKSSIGNGDSSSGGLEISSESARIEVPFHSDHVGIEGNFMGLRNSLDAEFSKMVGQPVNKYDSRKRSLDDIMIMGHNTENEEKYFEEVDPIPIPGPPGSFLPPSPGADMVSEEELQGNSSLTTTSRVHSNEDQRHHDLMKTDFISDSPVSTVSSPSFARSGDKLSLRFTSHQNKKSVNSSDLRSVDHASFTEKGPTPCCCSGKEGVSSQSVPSYHQESPLGLNHSINFIPNLFPLTLPPPETVKPLVDASVKSAVNGDRESIASPTTPVLRLMGKNLTVVKTDDDASLKPPCSSPMGQYPQFQNIQNENDNSFFYGYPPHHHVIFNQNQNGSRHQRFNPQPPNNSRNLADSSSANVDTNATREIIVIDDSSENECHDPHMFKESLIRNRGSSSSSLSFANPYGNGSFQTSSNLQEVVNDGNFGRWVSTETRYPLSSIASMTSSTAWAIDRRSFS